MIDLDALEQQAELALEPPRPNEFRSLVRAVRAAEAWFTQSDRNADTAKEWAEYEAALAPFRGGSDDNAGAGEASSTDDVGAGG